VLDATQARVGDIMFADSSGSGKLVYNDEGGGVDVKRGTVPVATSPRKAGLFEGEAGQQRALKGSLPMSLVTGITGGIAAIISLNDDGDSDGDGGGGCQVWRWRR
jgi:hypothetical protein